MTIEQRMLKEVILAKYQTNHILHILLSLLTAGLWIIAWIIMTLANKKQRNHVIEDFDLLYNKKKLK